MPQSRRLGVNEGRAGHGDIRARCSCPEVLGEHSRGTDAEVGGKWGVEDGSLRTLRYEGQGRTGPQACWAPLLC